MNNVCKYPECCKCIYDDCILSEFEIQKIKATVRKRTYRDKVRSSIPCCDDCGFCTDVKCDKGDGVRRLCQKDMRLIDSRIKTSPDWCLLRK